FLLDLRQDVYADMFDGIRDVADARQRHLVLAVGSIDGQRDAEALDNLLQSRVDVVIATGLLLEDDAVRAFNEHVPLVSVAPQIDGVDSVHSDNLAGATAATEHLISLGHRRIGAIGRHPGVSTGSVRLKGYRAALREAGLPVEPDLIMATENYSREEGRLAMLQLLSLPEPPDAVFCFNDLMAIGALRACAERGVRVPEDVAVAGFDDSLEGRYTTPSLTSVTPDMDFLVDSVLRLLTRRIQSPGTPGEQVRVPWALVLRESTLGRPAS
ncbi:MAG TPA: substrate-binding domain-containing protein, partial [Arachnia sp.]|nr:substrate-binding domain-containing protein [Arachnia sp.]